MRTSRALGALPLAALLLAAAPDSGPAVHIKNFAFTPATITVRAGTKVTFTNDDDEPHTATAVDKSFDSEGIDTHQSWQHTFSKPGSYAYFCEMHPYMKGRIVVVAADAGSK
ncbi:MAG: cupredoxin family copper-binding protein [Candidatus Eremiobacteraeota bacterium]|nr:cupredoxin family copper-binding protein [Candidatus Eremiobacteraeota bacterium]